MGQLTLEQASTHYAKMLYPGATESNTNYTQAKSDFAFGAEWQKEQLKAHMQKVISTLENEFAKQLVENVTAILFS